MSDITPLPPIGKADANIMRVHIDRRINYQNPIRAKEMAKNRRAELYDRGAQWLWEAQAGFDGSIPTQYVEVYWGKNNPNAIPTPVFNEGVGIRTNESARLAHPSYRPVARPKSSNPTLEATMGAKKARDLIAHRLDEMEWESKDAPLMYYHIPVYGGVWLISEWVATWDKTTTAPVLGARKCPCGFSAADSKVPEKLLRGMVGSENAIQPGPDGMVKLDACPGCGGPLSPFQPTLQEARTLKDSLGQPMGKDVPLGDWFMRVPNMADVFPRNMGLDQRPGRIDEWVEVHVETMDWIARRWPDKMEDIKPERASTLAQYHPVGGAPDVYHGVLETGLFEDCARVKEWHRGPQMSPTKDEQTGKTTWAMDQGRSVVMVGDKLVQDIPYLIPSENKKGDFIERAMIDYCPWEIKEGGRYIYGLGIWDILFDGQDARNNTLSQEQAVNERLAVPLYWVLREHNLEIVEMGGGLPGRMAALDAIAGSPGTVPQLANNTTVAPGIPAQGKDAVEFMQRGGKNVEVDRGQVPPNVGAAQAIEMLTAASSVQREPAQKRIKACLRRMWRHGARLMAGLYLPEDARSYRFEDEDGEERNQVLEGGGKDFKGQTDIDIDGEPDYDVQAREVETIRDLIQLTILNPETLTPTQARKIAKKLKAPEDLFEDEDLQNAAAQREFIDFRNRGKRPVLDPGLDDHSEHYQTHGRAAHDPFIKDLEERADWDGALSAALEDSWEQLSMLGYMRNGMCLQDRIGAFWDEMLMMVGWVSPDPEAWEQLKVWRSHGEAHRITDEMKQAAAMMGPTLAAPGAEATEAGNQPNPSEDPADPMAVPQPEMVQ